MDDLRFGGGVESEIRRCACTRSHIANPEDDASRSRKSVINQREGASGCVNKGFKVTGSFDKLICRRLNLRDDVPQSRRRIQIDGENRPVVESDADISKAGSIGPQSSS